jgi:SAM-dependent methyltransferase
LKPFPAPAAFALALLCTLFAGGAAAQGVAADRAACERPYKPRPGQDGRDVVWVPTPDAVVQRMLQIAEVTPADVVYDLGAGDGKITIAAARLGARAVGIEFNPDMVRLAQCYVNAEGLADRVRIERGDVFVADFSRATVVTMYLLPELNLRLIPKLLKDLKPGTRIVSHAFDMGGWQPEHKAMVADKMVYRWTIPAPGTAAYAEAMAASRQ